MKVTISKNLALYSLVSAALALSGAQALAQDASAGEAMWGASCAQCHGPSGQGVGMFPSVAGEEADYIASRLMQYRAGETVGSNSAMMIPAAANLSDDDIDNLAAYISENFQ